MEGALGGAAELWDHHPELEELTQLVLGSTGCEGVGVEAGGAEAPPGSGGVVQGALLRRAPGVFILDAVHFD
jgi:hypothetical protein